MPTQVSPMLAVSDGSAAIVFYQSSFGAELLWKLGEGADVVAGLVIDGAKFFLAKESPEYGTQSPNNVNFTTVRIELFVDDPFDVHAKAVAAGAMNRNPVTENRYDMPGPHPIRRILQGSVVDPFGHIWLIGKILE